MSSKDILEDIKGHMTMSYGSWGRSRCQGDSSISSLLRALDEGLMVLLVMKNCW